MPLILNGTTGVSGIDGSAGTPSYVGGDSDTGLWYPAANTLALSTSGSERLRIDSSGNVGIGTSSPSSRLDVSGVLSFQGTTLPSAGTARIFSRSSDSGFYLQGATGGTTNLLDGSQNTMAVFGSSTVQFMTGNTERMRIDSSGNVGIGLNPGGNYQLEGGTGTSAASRGFNLMAVSGGFSGGDYPSIGYNFRTTASSGSYTYNAADTAARILFSSVGTTFSTAAAGTAGNAITWAERMRITNAGTLLVGTTTSGSGTNPGITVSSNADTLVSFNYSSLAGFASAISIDASNRSANSGFNFYASISNRPSIDNGTGQDVEFLLRGDGNGYADGTWNNNGADYAEFFESATGQAIPVGSTVVLENNKVRLATESDNPADVIGVIRPKEPSKASMVVGNTAWNKWANKYLTDDFDRYIMEDHDVVEWTDADGKQHSYESHNIPEDTTIPADAIIKTHDDKGIKFQHYKLNPAWNPDAEYINRENRDEWLIIGLVGQVKVLKGQVMGERWRKMRDVSSSVEEWFIR